MTEEQVGHEQCAKCGKDLTQERAFFMCDELMQSFCVDHWEEVKCEELHGEGCETRVFQ